jgi:3-oxoacyl-[acyl-carrier-protein] synthase-1
MQPLAIIASGMVTPVGLDAPSSCAAIRCAIDHFTETRFMDDGGEWIIGGQVPLEQSWRGLSKLVHMAAPAIRECLSEAKGISPDKIPLLLCVAEKDRPGRLEGLDNELFKLVEKELGVQFHPKSAVIAQGRIGGALALVVAQTLMKDERTPFCLIAGVDSFLVAPTLMSYQEKQRLLTSNNSNGFIPGEAGAAILVGLPPRNSSDSLCCLGMGRGKETATIESEEPLRGEGMVQAFKSAFADAACTYEQVDYRVCDCNGEQYGFKEAALALTRTLRVQKEDFEIWHAADCSAEGLCPRSGSSLPFRQ